MKPAAFDFSQPKTIQQTLTLLADNPDSKLLAGGQSLVPTMNFRLAAPTLLVDLNRVAELSSIHLVGDTLQIGAMTRQSALLSNPLVAAHAPLLTEAAPYIGHLQTRSRGTVGGSLAHADPSAELPLVMVALNATIIVQSLRGRRTIAARDFFTGIMTTELAPTEMITDIAIPIAPTNRRTCFREIARRHGDFAIVAVAAQAWPDSISVAVGGLEAVPRFCRVLCDGLAQREFVPAWLSELIQNELADALPLSDLHADANFRRHLAAVLLADVLEQVISP